MLTLKIKEEYPELYKYLNETPVTIPSTNNPEITTKSFSDWLDSLKHLLEHHIENQKLSQHTQAENKNKK